MMLRSRFITTNHSTVGTVARRYFIGRLKKKKIFSSTGIAALVFVRGLIQWAIVRMNSVC